MPLLSGGKKFLFC